MSLRKVHCVTTINRTQHIYFCPLAAIVCRTTAAEVDPSRVIFYHWGPADTNELDVFVVEMVMILMPLEVERRLLKIHQELTISP
jgi:hypothetical protein